jgi:hypothetical protein
MKIQEKCPKIYRGNRTKAIRYFKLKMVFLAPISKSLSPKEKGTFKTNTVVCGKQTTIVFVP